MGFSPDARAALEWIRDDFGHILDTVTTTELTAPTAGTRWTNRELIFHLWFGQRITRAFIALIGGFSRLPPPVSRGWAQLLGAATKPYEWINYAASVAGGRAVRPETLRRWMHNDTRAILAWADRATDAQMHRGMSVPPSWDPYFQPWMNRADLLEWAPRHYRHHRAQLTIEAL